MLNTAALEQLLGLAEDSPSDLQVVLEITERSLVARPAELLRTVERVRDLGWRVALDDVGAESASLAFMPLLRPDVIKLDLRLVQQRPGPAVAEIMNAVNAYAERSGAVLLAEGIEDEGHLKMALALSASLGQGWMFGRPAPHAAEDLPTAELLLPAIGAAPTAVSPFDCLPEGTVLRTSPKSLLIEVSKQREREAIKVGEACVVATTFQAAAVHLGNRLTVPRPGRPRGIRRLRAGGGVAARAGTGCARCRPRAGRPGSRGVGCGDRRPALHRRRSSQSGVGRLVVGHGDSRRPAGEPPKSAVARCCQRGPVFRRSVAISCC